MGSVYTILGAKVPAHYISIATLLTAGIGGWAATRGSPASSDGPKADAPKPAAAPLENKAEDIDVEKLLNDFLKDNEEEKK